MVCTRAPAACQTGTPDCNTCAQSATRTNCAGGGAWNTVIGKSARSVARVHVKPGSLDTVILRVFGIAARAWIFRRNRVPAGSLRFGTARKPGSPVAQSGCPTQKHGGCYPHRRFLTFIPGLARILRRSGFHWVNKPSKASPTRLPQGVDTNWRGALARSEKHRAS
jgi:hypothetical protein